MEGGKSNKRQRRNPQKSKRDGGREIKYFHIYIYNKSGGYKSEPQRTRLRRKRRLQDLSLEAVDKRIYKSRLENSREYSPSENNDPIL